MNADPSGRNLRRTFAIAAGLAMASSVAIAGSPSPCPFGEPTDSWTVGESTVVACPLGGAPERLGANRWRGSGVVFYKMTPDREPRLVLGSSEAKPPLEYSFTDGDLTFLIYTHDPRSPSPVVLFRRVLEVGGNEVETTVEVVLEPPGSDPAKVDRILSRLSGAPPEGGRWAFDEVEEMLFTLRNHGLLDPAAMSERLQALRYPVLDGAAAEALAQVLEELRLVQASQQSVSE